MIDRETALAEMLRIGQAASRVILEKYEGELSVEWKGHNDPVTALDREVNALVVEALSRSFPGVPIVAEESDPGTWAARDAAEAFFVDPVDGTKDLILRNGEFSVMLGLAEAGRATAGVVVWPTAHRSFIGAVGEGAHEIAGDGSRKVIHVAEPKTLNEVRALVSRSHPDPAVRELLDKLGITKIEPMGSAGLKVVAVACGAADAYVHLTGGGKLWDACGPEAILREAGGVLTDGSGLTLDYRGDLGLKGMIATSPTVLGWLRS